MAMMMPMGRDGLTFCGLFGIELGAENVVVFVSGDDVEGKEGRLGLLGDEREVV